MSRYDGLIIPRSYSEYINKTDAATLQQALQLSGVLSGAVAAGDNKAVKSSAVNNALYTNIDGIIYNEFIDDLDENYLSASQFLEKHLPNLFTSDVFYSLEMTAIEKNTGKYVRVLYNCKKDTEASFKVKEENGLGVSTFNVFGTVLIERNTNKLIQKTKILTIVQNGTYIPL